MKHILYYLCLISSLTWSMNPDRIMEEADKVLEGKTVEIFNDSTELTTVYSYVGSGRGSAVSLKTAQSTIISVGKPFTRIEIMKMGRKKIILLLDVSSEVPSEQCLTICSLFGMPIYPYP